MSAIFAVVALVILAGAVALGWFVAKAGGPRTWLWCLLLGVVIAGSLFVAQIVQIQYRPTAVWLIALAAGLIAAVVLFILIGKDVGWKGGRITALVGMVLVVIAAFVFSAMAMPAGDLFVPLFEDRAQQMAEEQGFDLLLAPDEAMFTEYLPVEEVGSGDGVQIQYERFTLAERAVDVPVDSIKLREFLGESVEPLGEGAPAIPGDAVYMEVAINGAPGLVAEYEDRSTAEKGSLGIEDVRVLAFARDGVLVTIYSHGWMEYEPSDDSYTPVDALSADELVKIAESLEPAG